MKKIFVGLLTLGAALVVIPMFAAFEAHVINVTAKIENALSVPVTPITFGTVFPQEELERTLGIELSGSFIEERNANDVDYIIRQKPKCAVTNEDGTAITGSTWTGHVNPDGTVDCDTDRPVGVTGGGLLPSLCEYISKHPDGVDDSNEVSTNDGSLNSFHEPWTTDGSSVTWTNVLGRLAKSENDTTDIWTIDLAVPCFGGFCGQDWADFVNDINPAADPDDYTQDIDDEHKVFGCNLWVEVTGVSRNDQ